MRFQGDNMDATVRCAYSTIAKAVQLLSKLPFSTTGIASPTVVPYFNLELALLKGTTKETWINSVTLTE